MTRTVQGEVVPAIERRTAVARILAKRGDALVVTGITDGKRFFERRNGYLEGSHFFS